METLNIATWLLVVIMIVAVWELIWKGFALWKSARNNHLPWFVCILIFNTAGLLPIIYLVFFSDKKIKTKKNKSSKKK